VQEADNRVRLMEAEVSERKSVEATLVLELEQAIAKGISKGREDEANEVTGLQEVLLATQVQFERAASLADEQAAKTEAVEKKLIQCETKCIEEQEKLFAAEEALSLVESEKRSLMEEMHKQRDVIERLSRDLQNEQRQLNVAETIIAEKEAAMLRVMEITLRDGTSNQTSYQYADLRAVNANVAEREKAELLMTATMLEGDEERMKLERKDTELQMRESVVERCQQLQDAKAKELERQQEALHNREVALHKDIQDTKMKLVEERRALTEQRVRMEQHTRGLEQSTDGRKLETKQETLTVQTTISELGKKMQLAAGNCEITEQPKDRIVERLEAATAEDSMLELQNEKQRCRHLQAQLDRMLQDEGNQAELELLGKKVMQLEAEREELKAKACAESEAFAQQKKEEIASLQSQFHRVSQEICAAALEGQESLKLEAELLRAEVVQLKAEQDQHQNEKKEVQVNTRPEQRLSELTTQTQVIEQEHQVIELQQSLNEAADELDRIFEERNRLSQSLKVCMTSLYYQCQGQNDVSELQILPCTAQV